MRRLTVLLALSLITLSSLAVGVPNADAGRCNGCERVRRLCLFENKFEFDVEKSVCEAARLSCFDDCDAAFSSNRDLRVCKRACKENAVSWRGNFIDALFAGREVCDNAADACEANCDDAPRSSFQCLRACSKTILRCAQDAKKTKERCFHACRIADDDVRGCKRACREIAVIEQRACSDAYGPCNDGCLNP